VRARLSDYRAQRQRQHENPRNGGQFTSHVDSPFPIFNRPLCCSAVSGQHSFRRFNAQAEAKYVADLEDWTFVLARSCVVLTCKWYVAQ
jgi:hypothetical protein